MKKLCFGTLLNLVYQARGQNVKYRSICDAIFTAYGCDDMSRRDKSLPSHLKSGHGNVPPDVVDAARNMGYEEAIQKYDEKVVRLVADEKQFIYAVKAVLREDDIPNDTLIGYVSGFEKGAILKNNKLCLEYSGLIYKISIHLTKLLHFFTCIINPTKRRLQNELLSCILIRRR